MEPSTYERCEQCTKCDGYGCEACLGDLLNPPPADPAVTARLRREAAAARDAFADFQDRLIGRIR